MPDDTDEHASRAPKKISHRQQHAQATTDTAHTRARPHEPTDPLPTTINRWIEAKA
jgi:hypothetical protein